MKNTRLLRVLLIACALCAVLSGQTLFVGSSDSSSSFVYGLRSDPLTSPSSLLGAPSFFQALPVGSPIANHYWLFSKNATGTVTVVDSSLSYVLRKFDLGSAPVAVAGTPDGRRVLVLTSTLRIFDTSSETEITFTGDVGVNPSDIAISWDSRRAYVLSTASQRLTTVDLGSNSVSGGNVVLPAGATAVSVSPTGLIYVSAGQSLYEYYQDYFSASPLFRMQFTGVTGIPGKLSFTPDASRAATVDAYSNIEIFDLNNRVMVGQTSVPSGASKLVIPDNSRLYVVNGAGRLYQTYIGYLSSLSEASFTSVGTFTGVRDIAISNENPSARFLFVTAGAILQRIDLNSNTASGQVITAAAPGALSLPPTGNLGTTPFYLLTFNGSQTVPLNAQPLPLIVRVTDVTGRPIAGVHLTFSATTTGATVVTPAVVTGLDGSAGTTVVLGSVAAQYVISASIDGTSINTSFSVTGSGTGTGTGGGTTSGGLSVWAGTGQVIGPRSKTGTGTAESLIVKLVDSNGNPISGQTVTWTVASDSTISGDGLDAYTSTTDADGFASTNYVSGIVNYIQGFGQPIARSVITASTSYQYVSFTVLTLANQFRVGAFDPGMTAGFMVHTVLQPASRTITGKIGQTLTGAVQVRAVANGSYQFPGVGVRVFDSANNTISSYCNNGFVFTDSTGLASCDLVVKGLTGTRVLTIRTGSQYDDTLTLTALPGDAASFGNVTGDNQAGKPGTKLPVALSAIVTDSAGNPIAGASVNWSVPVAGSVTLTNQSSVSDSQGRVSAVATLGSTPGTAQVILTSGAATYTFTLTTQIAIGAFAYVSGDAQTATIGTAYAQPLVVRVTDSQGKGIPGLSVSFAVTSGVATLASASVTTDADGKASNTVTAGSTAGAIVVQATTTGQSPVNFNLTALLPGPVFSAAQIVNAASFQAGVSPGALVTIYARGVATSLNGAVLGNVLGFGPLPLKLAGVEVSFGGFGAPIYSVVNISGQESVTVQVPYELTAGTSTSVTIKVNGVATTVDNVPVKRLTPGIFETTDAQSNRYAIVMKSDGSFVSPGNPAVRGENLTIYVSGLGAVSPATFTNRLGAANQTVTAPIVVGVNNAGNSGAYTAVLSPTLIGVYQITFQLDATAAAGNNIPLSISAQDVDATRIFSNSTFLAAVK